MHNIKNIIKKSPFWNSMDFLVVSSSIAVTAVESLGINRLGAGLSRRSICVRGFVGLVWAAH